MFECDSDEEQSPELGNNPDAYQVDIAWLHFNEIRAYQIYPKLLGDLRLSEKDKAKWIRRIARIWSFSIIVYSLIMLADYAWAWVTIGKADSFAVESYPKVEALPPIFLFLSILGLAIAWCWEGLGGTIALVLKNSNDCVTSNSKADHP